MIIETEDESLWELCKSRQLFEMAQDINELMRIGRLHYKRLSGDLKEYESVRCNGRWRLVFKSYADQGQTKITNVKLIKLSDHYEDL